MRPRDKKITVLFDIDGTLMLTGGAGIAAMKRSVERLFGMRDYPELDYHGRTDFAIARDLFAQIGISFEQHFHAFRRDYHLQLQEELSRRSGYLLPGVFELLVQLTNDERFSIGLLTGNAREAAGLKLTTYGIQNFFDYGGYGDFHDSRDDVAREARSAAASRLGATYCPLRTLVIGDTPADIRCARAIGAVAIAVATGGSDCQTLKASAPDLVCSTLLELRPAALADWPFEPLTSGPSGGN